MSRLKYNRAAIAPCCIAFKFCTDVSSPISLVLQVISRDMISESVGSLTDNFTQMSTDVPSHHFHEDVRYIDCNTFARSTLDTLHYTALFSTVLYCTLIHCTAPHNITLHSSALPITDIHCTNQSCRYESPLKWKQKK